MLTAPIVFKVIVIGITAAMLFVMADDWFDNGGLH